MSVIAIALKHMLAAGVPHDQIIEAVAEMESAFPKDAQAERRRAADRERKRLRNSAETAETADSVDPPFSDKERSPTPPKEINSNPRETKRARGSRLPDDWALPAKWGQWALSEGWIEADIRFEAERFRDFWCSKAGKDATKIDWEATWRNWIRSAKGRSQQRSQPTQKPKTPFQEHQEACREAMRKPKIGEFDEPQFASNHYAIDLDARDWRSH